MGAFCYNGKNIKLTVEGESHSVEISALIEGKPEVIDKINVDEEKLQAFLDRRAPGKNSWSTPRKEPDKAILERSSGMIYGKIVNTNTKPHDYSGLLKCPRPSHADYTAKLKYGESYTSSGGGSFSGRMTAPLCIAGGIALQELNKMGISIYSHIKSIGGISDINIASIPLLENDSYLARLAQVKNKEFPTVSDEAGEKMIELIRELSIDLDSVGGVTETIIVGVPGGVGGPLFDGIEGKIAGLMFAVPAVKGIEFGNGFEGSTLKGSENNDNFTLVDGKVKLKTNHSGGILGGISVGEAAPIVFSTAFKPTPSIAKEQKTVDLDSMTETTIEIKGRHDPCIVPRAVPVTEAVTALALWDMLLG